MWLLYGQSSRGRSHITSTNLIIDKQSCDKEDGGAVVIT